MSSSSRPTVNDNQLKKSLSVNSIQHKRDAESVLKPIESINEEKIMRLMRECLKNDSIQKEIANIVKINDNDVEKSIEKSTDQIVQILLKLVLIEINDRLNIINKQVQEYQEHQLKTELKLDDIERRSRSYNLRFYGIREDEDAKKQIVNIACGMNISLSDIEVVHRLGAKQNGKHRAVIACFYSREAHYALLTSRKFIQQLQGRKFYILEDCTDRTMFLYNTLRSKLNEASKHFVYIRNGRVLYKTSLNEKPKLISKEQDINLVTQSFSSQQKHQQLAV
ncbi:unnamed protein product [Didymodactylos carnosus]|uniref:Uncharacterized protein n=1 Tax=Didymodactylos carnosus TaxID=1234261 RepID=A0A814R4C8_9BILA|nr:unnamed protein product [Didymodactylos carnosus]CAF1128164.1 unnamed protein product [Didymodactylos carnosus]CAF3692068.1 unnamed protein product [Didymodactylos carnosus]CAF3891656.1 unnamed protein product [Didymodactylos carnosus]